MQGELDNRFCDACGQSNRSAAHFCASCGLDLPDLDPTTKGLAPADLALRWHERGVPLKARSILESALVEHPDDHHLRLVYAVILLQSAEWQAAMVHLERLRESAPWSPVVEAYIGGALLGLNRVSDAKETLDDAVARAPDDFYVLLKRGEVYCRLGIYQTAVDALERAMAVGSDDPIGREAVRRLLRFAREKTAGGFVRQLRARTTGFNFGFNFTGRWWPVRKPTPARADEVWGT